MIFELMKARHVQPKTLSLSLRTWLVSPRIWSTDQRLALGSLGCIFSSIGLTLLHCSSVGASFFAISAFLFLSFIFLITLVAKFKTKKAFYSLEQNQSRRASLYFVFGASSLLAIVTWWMYISQIGIMKDVNAESMDIPLVVGHLLRAREEHMSARRYFETDPICLNLKQQDPAGAFGYFGHRFQFQFMAEVGPLLSTLYIPLVKWLGVTSKTVAVYSTSLSLFELGATLLLAWNMFGPWPSFLAALWLVGNFSRLIHVHQGYTAWPPSAILTVLLAAALYEHSKNPSKKFFLIAGPILGLLYVVGWLSVVFAVLMILLVFLLEQRLAWKNCLKQLILSAFLSLVTITLFTLLYSSYEHLNFISVNQTLLDNMLSRFKGGAVPGHNLSPGEKFFYAFKCMFLDMTTFDHMDKLLEGKPGNSEFFGALFLIGLFYAFKNRTCADKILLCWLISVFGFMGTIFTYTHRYALLALPAMCIVAGRGVDAFYKDLLVRSRVAAKAFFLVVAIGMALTLWVTHRNYYVDFTFYKPPDFEVDRMRGHADFANWLRKNSPPENTLVVLGDPIMFARTCFLFDTFTDRYPFVYWSNYFGSNSSSQQVKEWEQEALRHYSHVIFAFSTRMLGNVQTQQFMNDWRPFNRAHPGLQPVFTYSYSGRPASIVAFKIDQGPATR